MAHGSEGWKLVVSGNPHSDGFHDPRFTEDLALPPDSVVLVLLVVCASLLLSARIPLSGAGPRFYDDDPLTREPETQDASGVQPREIDLVSRRVAQPVHAARRPVD